MDVTQTEILFAQKLVCGEPRIRKKALNRLRKWLSNRASDNTTNFNEDDFLRLWKGLYYCLWMQDKPLLQEQVTKDICNLIQCFISNNDQVLLWIAVFYKTLAREWHTIDRWRLDKFLALMRKFYRCQLEWLKEGNFAQSLVDRSIEIWKETFLASDCERTMKSNIGGVLVVPEGLKFHFASIFLDELDLVFGPALSEENFAKFLKPFLDILSNPSTSDYLFDTVIEEIFDAILLQHSQAVQNLKTDVDAEESNSEDPAEDGIKFNFEQLSTLVFTCAKEGKISGKRRRKLYDLVQRLRIAGEGGDAMVEEISSGSELSDDEITSAAKRYLKLTKGNKDGKKKLKSQMKRKRKQNDAQSDDDSDCGLDIVDLTSSGIEAPEFALSMKKNELPKNSKSSKKTKKKRRETQTNRDIAESKRTRRTT